MDKKLFGDLTFRTRFIFYGKTYTKIALNMAEDESRHGHIFMDEVEVEQSRATHQWENLKRPDSQPTGRKLNFDRRSSAWAETRSKVSTALLTVPTLPFPATRSATRQPWGSVGQQPRCCDGHSLTRK
jgi:hypothetical protein